VRPSVSSAVIAAPHLKHHQLGWRILPQPLCQPTRMCAANVLATCGCLLSRHCTQCERTSPDGVLTFVCVCWFLRIAAKLAASVTEVHHADGNLEDA
jgi:hypothetical protein